MRCHIVECVHTRLFWGMQHKDYVGTVCGKVVPGQQQQHEAWCLHMCFVRLCCRQLNKGYVVCLSGSG